MTLLLFFSRTLATGGSLPAPPSTTMLKLSPFQDPYYSFGERVAPTLTSPSDPPPRAFACSKPTFGFRQAFFRTQDSLFF